MTATSENSVSKTEISLMFGIDRFFAFFENAGTFLFVFSSFLGFCFILASQKNAEKNETRGLAYMSEHLRITSLISFRVGRVAPSASVVAFEPLFEFFTLIRLSDFFGKYGGASRDFLLPDNMQFTREAPF